MVKKEIQIDTQYGRDVNTEKGDFHTCFLLVGNPMHDLITNETLRAPLSATNWMQAFLSCAYQRLS